MKVRFWAALAPQLLLFGALNLFDDWTLESMPSKFVVCAILSGLAYLLAASEFSSTGRAALWIFWLATIAMRLLALPLAPANEVWRYQADGIIQRAGFDPYKVAPADPRVAKEIEELARVPRREEPAAYAPAVELLFRLLPARSGALTYKIFFGLSELVCIVLLLRLCDVRIAAWFAWNPLSAYSFFGAGHFDSILLLAIVAFIFCLTRVEEKKRGGWIFALGAAIALAMGIVIRPIAIVFVLPCAFALGRRAIALFAGLAIPVCLAFLFKFPQAQQWNLFGDFNHVSRLNDLFWWLVEETVLPNWHQQYFRYDVVILVVSVLLGLIFARDWRRGMLWTISALVILAPVLHAWYVLWILPVATWRRAYAWHFLAVTIFAYYLFFNERLFALPWHAEPWMRGMIVLPVLFAMAMLAVQKSPLQASS